SHDGKLWFATANGVSVIDPEHLRTDSASYQVAIEQVRVDGRIVDTYGKIRVRADAKAIEIHYTAPSLIDPARLVFPVSIGRLPALGRSWLAAGRLLHGSCSTRCCSRSLAASAFS